VGKAVGRVKRAESWKPPAKQKARKRKRKNLNEKHNQSK
jgi:hypothetical protein